ncbi:MAG: glycosyltransferase, partial [Gemmatimonadetes bacterium]|nr:glycosyltransferase [Gemmatimonadota bacterium]
LPDLYLLATGAGDRRKNVAFLLDVLRHWPGGDPPTLVVTGSAHGHVHAAQSLPRRDELPVHVLGRVRDDDLRALYTGAAAFCFPSLAEGFGRPPLEAMGCGAPVVAAAYATAADVLGDAAIILGLDPDAWARTLARVVSTPAEQAALRARGRRRAALYDWDVAAEQVLAACERAQGAGGGGRVGPKARVSGARAVKLSSSAARAELQRAEGPARPSAPARHPLPRVAMVHDWLVRMRGGERCLEALLGVFPEADVFTLLHVPGAVSPVIERRLRATSFINSLPAVRRLYPYYLPLFPAAIERFDLRGYDLVISISHCVAKGAPAAGVPHLCYCLTPMRYVWDMYQTYFGDGRSASAVSGAMKVLAPRLRRWDVESAARVNRWVAISSHVRQRIARIYGRPADVVYPPVAVDRFRPAPRRQDFYLAVSALVPYKRLDVAVEAFTRLGRPLVIVGEGSEYGRLKARTGPNVRFTGWIPDAEVADLMGRCRAFVYPAEEDFGIALVEAQAAGAPVIGYGAGGALETVVGWSDQGEGVAGSPTGLFFREQTPQALMEAVRRFETLAFDPAAGPANAARFSLAAFQEGIKGQVERLLAEDRTLHPRRP